MYSKYLVTGGTGFLGSAVVRELLFRKVNVRVLVFKGDAFESDVPSGIELVYGDVTDKASLIPFFEGTNGDTCVIHCAGIVSVATKTDDTMNRVNVGGTRNIISMCRERGIAKLVYVSSVHTIPEKPMGQMMSEVNRFSSDAVRGGYAKSKAIATAVALSASKEGLNVSVVQPSGIIGPGDRMRGSITEMLISYFSGGLRIGVSGGYDFVDVRDVAEGIVSCAENGRSGECYILSGEYVSVKELLQKVRHLTGGKRIYFYTPLSLASLIAPIYEKRCLKLKVKPFFTPYSMFVLGTNSLFSHKKATEELGFKPRAISGTLADTIAWLRSEGLLVSKPKAYTQRTKLIKKKTASI